MNKPLTIDPTTTDAYGKNSFALVRDSLDDLRLWFVKKKDEHGAKTIAEQLQILKDLQEDTV